MSILYSEMNALQRVLLVGPPGIGKTARILDAATHAGRKPYIVRASLSERVDFGGCLVPNREKGVTEALPLALLKELQTTKEPSLLFLDDLGQAPIDVQAALMRLFDDGALSEHVLIWGATNRPSDRAGVSALCEPLRSRFHAAYVISTPEGTERADGGVILSDWPSEMDAWLNWAMDNGAPAEVVAWHRSTNGRTLYAWKPHADPSLRMPDFRSWGAMITRWNAGLRSLAHISAVIGKPAAAEFLAFAKLADQLPSPDQVWMDPDGAPVPKEPSAQYLIGATLAQTVSATTAEAFIKYVARMPRVMTAFCARDAYRRLGAKLSGSKAFVKWFTQNKELFETKA